MEKNWIKIAIKKTKSESQLSIRLWKIGYKYGYILRARKLIWI